MYKADRSSIHTIGALKEKNKTMKQLIFKTKNFSEEKKDQYLHDKKEAAMYLQKLTCNGQLRDLSLIKLLLMHLFVSK